MKWGGRREGVRGGGSADSAGEEGGGSAGGAYAGSSGLWGREVGVVGWGVGGSGVRGVGLLPGVCCALGAGVVRVEGAVVAAAGSAAPALPPAAAEIASAAVGDGDGAGEGNGGQPGMLARAVSPAAAAHPQSLPVTRTLGTVPSLLVVKQCTSAPLGSLPSLCGHPCAADTHPLWAPPITGRKEASGLVLAPKLM